jgi:hypothetical protein
MEGVFVVALRGFFVRFLEMRFGKVEVVRGEVARIFCACLSDDALSLTDVQSISHWTTRNHCGHSSADRAGLRSAQNAPTMSSDTRRNALKCHAIGALSRRSRRV